MELSPYRKRYNGYKRALEELGLTETSTLSSIPDNSFEYGFQCTEDLLEQNPNLDAIMAAVDIQGIGAMRAKGALYFHTGPDPPHQPYRSFYRQYYAHNYDLHGNACPSYGGKGNTDDTGGNQCAG